jgi:alkyl hydroperoxide reductase subunit AhpF
MIIFSLKKKLKHYEEEFEREYGYRASHADKMGNKDIKKMYAELNKLRKEVKCKCSSLFSHTKLYLLNKSFSVS